MTTADAQTASDYSVSVCVPVYNVSEPLLRRCLASVRTALRPGEQVIVVFDGPSAFRHDELVRTALPAAELIIHAEPAGLVGAWNEGFKHGRGDLIHIMHCDDAVDPAFYDMARLVFSDHPAIVAMATASGNPQDTAVRDMTAGDPGAVILRGSPLAQFLLSAAKPAAGSFVYRRSAVARAGLFSSEFEYCPDEEYALRLAHLGPMAILSLPLYLEQRHMGQHRFETWLKDDFTDVYMSARIRGSAPFDAATRDMAEVRTARNALSVVAWLVEHGRANVARHQLGRLRQLSPRVARWARYRSLFLIARVPGGSHILRMARWMRGHHGHHPSSPQGT